MSEQEKNRILEENFPSIETIIAEYKKQGKELTESEAEQIRNRIKDDMEKQINGDTLETVAGGVGGSPFPTQIPCLSVYDTKSLSYISRD